MKSPLLHLVEIHFLVLSSAAQERLSYFLATWTKMDARLSSAVTMALLHARLAFSGVNGLVGRSTSPVTACPHLRSAAGAR